MLYSVLLMGAILMGVPLGYPYLHSSRFYNVLLFDYSIRSLIVG